MVTVVTISTIQWYNAIIVDDVDSHKENYRWL
jgi:hypothetical protein